MKLYVLVRKDLNKSQQAVQAGHALAEILLRYPPNIHGWKNGTLIYLGTENMEELQEMYDKLWGRCVQAPFFEPYKNMGFTAFAAIGEIVSEELKDLELIDMQE